MDKEAITQTLSKMRKLAVPEPGMYAIAPLTSTKMSGKLTDILRVFSAIDPQKGRKPAGSDFNMYSDVLSDSPLTAATKMGAPWESYRDHVIVQLGVCNFRCWYCYVDYKLLAGKNVALISAETIMEQFFAQRQRAKANGKEYNVLRISGGEPMFAPDLILSSLKIVRAKGLEREVCIKTETNLSPLLKVGDKSFAEEWVSFDELAEYSNFYVHPTLHGISSDSLHVNSAVSPSLFEGLLEGLQTLLQHHIDVYPSFSSNTVPARDIPDLFKKLKSLNTYLPLRVAVRPFNFNYEIIMEREQGARELPVFEHATAIDVWNRLLNEEYGVGYAELPRHSVSLYQ